VSMKPHETNHCRLQGSLTALTEPSETRILEYGPARYRVQRAGQVYKFSFLKSFVPLSKHSTLIRSSSSILVAGRPLFIYHQPKSHSFHHLPFFKKTLAVYTSSLSRCAPSLPSWLPPPWPRPQWLTTASTSSSLDQRSLESTSMFARTAT